MDYDGRTFENETIDFDGNSFNDCTFINCILQYGGGAFTISGTTSMQGDWRVRFHGGAKDTARLLLFLIKGMGVSFADHFDVDAPAARDFN